MPNSEISRSEVSLPTDSGEASYAVDIKYADNNSEAQDASGNKPKNMDENDENDGHTNTDSTNESNSETDENDKTNETAGTDDDKNDDSSQDNSDQKADTTGLSKTQKRINTLTKRWRTAERELEILRQEKRTSANEPGANTELKEPDENDFSDSSKYVDALIDWKLGVAFLKQQADSQVGIEQDIQAKTADITKAKQTYINEVFDAAKAKYKDFDTVFNDNVPVSSAMMDSMLMIENTSDVAYYLGKNTTEAAEISKLPKVAAAMKIQRISTKLGTKKISKGPAPFNPVRGSSSSKTLDSMSYKEYKQEMEKREKIRLRH